MVHVTRCNPPCLRHFDYSVLVLQLVQVAWMTTNDDRDVGMMDDKITDTSGDGSPDFADPTTAANNEVSFLVAGGRHN